MQIPKRRAGNLPHIVKDFNITEDRYNQLKIELERLKKVVHPKAVAEVKRLAELGDFSENAEYQIAKGKLRGLNNRMMEMEDENDHAVIIKPQSNTNSVQLGSTVTVAINGIKKEFTILGASQTDPNSGVISHSSPIGTALLGSKVGDEVEIPLARKTVIYKILKID